jgi:RecB family exonuclease
LAIEPLPHPKADDPVRVVSYSEYDALRQCPLKHHLAYNERWTSPAVGKALQIGGLFHKILEAHYKRKSRAKALTRAALLKILAATPTTEDEYKETALWMYEGYVECYGADPQWEILGVEKELRVPLADGLVLKGKVDLLIKDNSAGGGLWIPDHKTCSTLPKEKDLDFDDQFGLYVWGMRQEGVDIRGVIHNACRTGKLKREMTLEERFKRTYTARTQKELDTIARECAETFQRGLLPWPGLPPRATDPDRCGWRCGFTEACLMSRKGGGDIRELLTDMGCAQDFTRH